MLKIQFLGLGESWGASYHHWAHCWTS